MRLLRFYIAVLIIVFAVQAAKAQSINNVLTAYFTVKNDLVADNASAAKTHVVDLSSAVKAVTADKIPAEQLPAWKRVQLSATHIGEAKDIDMQRDYFAVLSDNMITLTKALKFNSAPVYQQYCPMKKVNWLSEAPAIKNPFYGKQMLTCGQVTETLVAADK